jgi:hypothetical protein
MVTEKTIEDYIYQYTYHPSYADEDIVLLLEELLELRKLRDGEVEREKNLLAEIRELRDKTRWIHVAEKLPDDDIECLVADECGIYMAIMDDGAWWMDGHKLDGITHWMPLPEPPE